MGKKKSKGKAAVSGGPSAENPENSKEVLPSCTSNETTANAAVIDPAAAQGEDSKCGPASPTVTATVTSSTSGNVDAQQSAAAEESSTSKVGDVSGTAASASVQEIPKKVVNETTATTESTKLSKIEEGIPKPPIQSEQVNTQQNNNKPAIPPKPENLKPIPPPGLPKPREQSQTKTENSSNSSTDNIIEKSGDTSISKPESHKPPPPPGLPTPKQPPQTRTENSTITTQETMPPADTPLKPIQIQETVPATSPLKPISTQEAAPAAATPSKPIPPPKPANIKNTTQKINTKQKETRTSTEEKIVKNLQQVKEDETKSNISTPDSSKLVLTAPQGIEVSSAQQSIAKHSSDVQPLLQQKTEITKEEIIKASESASIPSPITQNKIENASETKPPILQAESIKDTTVNSVTEVKTPKSTLAQPETQAMSTAVSVNESKQSEQIKEPLQDKIAHHQNSSPTLDRSQLPTVSKSKGDGKDEIHSHENKEVKDIITSTSLPSAPEKLITNVAPTTVKNVGIENEENQNTVVNTTNTQINDVKKSIVSSNPSADIRPSEKSEDVLPTPPNPLLSDDLQLKGKQEQISAVATDQLLANQKSISKDTHIKDNVEMKIPSDVSKQTPTIKGSPQNQENTKQKKEKSKPTTIPDGASKKDSQQSKEQQKSRGKNNSTPSDKQKQKGNSSSEGEGKTTVSKTEENTTPALGPTVKSESTSASVVDEKSKSLFAKTKQQTNQSKIENIPSVPQELEKNEVKQHNKDGNASSNATLKDKTPLISADIKNNQDSEIKPEKTEAKSELKVDVENLAEAIISDVKSAECIIEEKTKVENVAEEKKTTKEKANKTSDDKGNKEISKKQKKNENKKGQTPSKQESSKTSTEVVEEDTKPTTDKSAKSDSRDNDRREVGSKQKQNKSATPKGKMVAAQNKSEQKEEAIQAREATINEKENVVSDKEEIKVSDDVMPKSEETCKPKSPSATSPSAKPDTKAETTQDSAKGKKQQTQSNKKARKESESNTEQKKVENKAGSAKVDKSKVSEKHNKGEKKDELTKTEKTEVESSSEKQNVKDIPEKQKKGKGGKENQAAQKKAQSNKDETKNKNKDKLQEISTTNQRSIPKEERDNKRSGNKGTDSENKTTDKGEKAKQQTNKQKDNEKKRKVPDSAKKGRDTDVNKKEEISTENRESTKLSNENKTTQEKKQIKQDKGTTDSKQSSETVTNNLSSEIKLEEEEEEEEIIQARPVYTANACHVCKLVHEGKTRLKSCGACRMIAYCGPEHQRQHWPQHKSVCKFVRKTVSREKIPGLFANAVGVVDAEEWRQFRLKYIHQCEEALGRSLQPYEREMFLYPRVCQTCHQSAPEKLRVCPQCYSINFCCPDHLKPDHDRWCPELRLLLEINQYQAKYGLVDPPLPDRVFTEFEPLPPTLKELLLTKVLEPTQAMGLSRVMFTGLTDIASYPLTVLFALQSVQNKGIRPVNDYESLTIHLVGAEIQFEGDAIAKWDVFLLHLLPSLKLLRIIFIGPELTSEQIPPGICNEDFRCAHCVNSSREFVCDFQPNILYHEYLKTPSYTKPDVICAFNCGLYRNTGFNGKDTWGQSLSSLVQDPEIPVILTAYTSVEAPKDVQRLQEQCSIDVLLPPQRNPYSSMRPQLNFVNDEDCPVIYRNQYLSVVRGKK